MSTNYEAIGRCVAMAEKIESLKEARQKESQLLQRQLSSSDGSIPGNVYTFDAEKAHNHLQRIVELNRQLMEAVTHYNEWAPEAKKQRIGIHEPFEQ